MSEAVLRTLVHGTARLWFRGVFYGRTLRGRRPPDLVFAPDEGTPGDDARGRLVLDGYFDFLGHKARTEDVARGLARPGEAWMAAFHGFDWLRDLRAAGDAEAAARARSLVAAWIAGNASWRPLSWRPDVLSRRVCGWLEHSRFLADGAEPSFAEAYLDSLARQVRHLHRVAPLVDPGLDRLRVLKAQIYAALCLPGGAGRTPRLARRLAHACDRQLLGDGGHAARSPAAQVEALKLLVDSRAAIAAAGLPAPEQLDRTIRRAAPMARFFRHGDGGLALFNGADEGEPALVDLVLARAAEGGRAPSSAPESGFERIAAGRTVLIADAGRPRTGFAGTHAGTLSFELSVGKQRIVVNCGAFGGRDETWRHLQRTTAAHSTLAIGDRNSSVLRDDGRLGRAPERVTRSRVEEGGRTWLDMSHDGYRRTLGLIHRRRLYVDPEGADIRGEDSLAGRGAHAFAIRFHLHPSVKASLVKDGTAVLLRLPDETGWRLRCDGGVASLQETVYLGRPGEARRSEQVVVAGETQDGAAVVKWALSRLSRG